MLGRRRRVILEKPSENNTNIESSKENIMTSENNGVKNEEATAKEDGLTQATQNTTKKRMIIKDDSNEVSDDEEVVITEEKNEGTKNISEDKSESEEDKIISFYANRVTKHFSIEDPAILQKVYDGTISKEDFLKKAKDFLLIILPEENQIYADKILYTFETLVWGYGKMEPLLQDREISDIKILGAGKGKVRYAQSGRRYSSENIYFKDDNEYNAYFEMIATKNSKGTSYTQASSSFTDKKSNDLFRLRITLTTSFISSTDEPVITIRKFPKFKRKPEEFINKGMMSKKTYDFLAKEIHDGESLIVCGRGGTWKSSIINTLMEEISDQDAIEIIQENEELFAENHPETINLHIVNPQGDGKIQYSLRDEATMGLLQDIDTFVIGEIKGPEAFDFVSANNSGTRTICSLHCNSAKMAAEKLVLLVKQAVDLGREDILRMMHNLGLIVHIVKTPDGRKINEIVRVKGFDETTKNLIYEEIALTEEEE